MCDGQASDEEGEGESGEESEGGLEPAVLRGLLEAIFLMWTAVAKQLDSVSRAPCSLYLTVFLIITETSG